MPAAAPTICDDEADLARACMVAVEALGGSPTFCVGDRFVTCTATGGTCEMCATGNVCDLETGCGNVPDAGPDMGGGECSVDDDCPAGVCEAGACVECRETGDCDEGVCNEDNECVGCVGDADCSGDGVCVGERCVECREDADCTGALVCVENACVPDGEMDGGTDGGTDGGMDGGTDGGADAGDAGPDAGGECGDGVIDDGEECDPPMPAECGMLAGCSETCEMITRVAVCGDDCADEGETCGEPGLTCAAGQNCVSCGCAAPRCGDGFADPGERCGEPGLMCGAAQTCADCACTPSICGDGVVDGAEDCGEPGLAACPAGQNCGTTTCQCGAPSCGDGTADMGEACGEPGLAACPAGQGCAACVCQPLCGNNATDPGEECGEPGLACGAGEECMACQCNPTIFCGNGRVDPGEQCDPPSAPVCTSSNYCNSSCQFMMRPRECGNGCIDERETCGEPGLSCSYPATCDGCTCSLADVEVGRPFALLAGTTDENLRATFNTAVTLTTPAMTAANDVAEPGVILVGNHVMIGINRDGSLDTSPSTARILGWDGAGMPGPVAYPAQNPGTGYTRTTPENGRAGFAYRDGTSGNFEEDVMSPGCLCEGWGVRYLDGATPRNGGANQAGNSLGPATETEFRTIYDATTGAHFVRSRVTVGGGTLEITMDYSLRRGDRYVAQRISLRSLSANSITDIRFVRTLDYDVGPFHFDGDTFNFLYPIGGGPQLIRSSDTAGDTDTLDDGETDFAGLYGYGVATVSPYLTCSNGITFANNDPNWILTQDQDGDAMSDCNDSPDGPGESPGDRSGSFVFQVPSLAPSATVEL